MYFPPRKDEELPPPPRSHKTLAGEDGLFPLPGGPTGTSRTSRSPSCLGACWPASCTRAASGSRPSSPPPTSPPTPRPIRRAGRGFFFWEGAGGGELVLFRTSPPPLNDFLSGWVCLSARSPPGPPEGAGSGSNPPRRCLSGWVFLPVCSTSC